MRRKSLMPRMRLALRDLVRSERGLSVPMVLMVIIVGLGLGGAAVVASIAAQRGTTRDQDAKNALAAADAGAQLAIYRENKVTTAAGSPCVVIGAGGVLGLGQPAVDGWCPAVQSTSDDHLPAGTSFTYRVKPWTVISTTHQGPKRQLEIVAVGASDNVSRRVETVATARTGGNVFGDAGAIGVEQITIGGSSDVGVTATVSNAATNGSILIDNQGSLCGNASHGVDGSVTLSGNGTQCPGFSQFTEELSLPPVDPGAVYTNNSNWRICNAQRTDPVTPTNACNPNANQNNRVQWDPTARTLTMTGNSTLTLGGSNYVFCQLNMSGNTQLIVAQGAVVNIFFPDPATCGLSGSPVNQINLVGNPRLLTTSQNPGDLRLLMVGSDTTATTATMTGNSNIINQFTLYAPRSDLTITGNATYIGAMAGKTLTAGGSAQILTNDSALNTNISVAIVYHRDRYVECTGGTMASPPDSSC